MSKGYRANVERMEEIGALGKAIAKRAGFKCEWCGSKDDLRVRDYRPDINPDMGTLAMLCHSCRELADGRKADQNQLRTIRNALWSDVPAVAEGAAKVLAQCNQTWVKEAIEESCIDEELKEQLLSRTEIWK
jgi:hypothetical protein